RPLTLNLQFLTLSSHSSNFQFRFSSFASLQSVFLPLFQKRFSADAKNLCRAADLVMGSFQRRGDDLAFHLFQRTQPRNRAGRAWSCRSNRLGKILRLQNVVLADGRAVACAREDDRTL